MSAVKEGPKAATGKRLPVVTVGKFGAATRLIERLFAAQSDGFLTKMQEYQSRHREATGRPLTAEEAAKIATGMREVLGDQADSPADLQQSDLYAYDQPGSKELLAAAGLATAPALIDACSRLVALIEMPTATFRAAEDDHELDMALDEAAAKFEDLSLSVARERTVNALAHFGEAAGVGQGEALRSLIQMVLGAWEQAAVRVATEASSGMSQTGLPDLMDGPVPAS